MYDLLIKNALLITGIEREPFQGDIAVKGEWISKIGKIKNQEAELVIDASGMIVCPGFIDIHCHDEIEVLKNSIVESKLRQGVTTIVNGNCGMGFYPLVDKNKDLLLDYNAKLFSLENVDISWNSFEEYSRILEEKGLGMNIVTLVGHGALRIAVMGFDEREPTEVELEEMIVLLEKEIENGAFGMSSGLLYPPSSYAEKEEIKALCKVLAEHDLLYTVHMRNESDRILDNIKENIEIAGETGVSVEISHLNVSGRDNWGKSEEIIDLLTRARAEGVNINCDQYPYKAGSTFLTACLPQWTLNQGVNTLINNLKANRDGIKDRIEKDIREGIEGWDNIIKSSGWDNIIVNSVNSRKNQNLLGKSLKEISIIWGLDYFETLFRILIEEEGKVTILIFSVCDEDLYNIFKTDFVMVGTDGIKLDGKPHPRLYGTYPKIINRFVKEKGLVSLKEAIRKMTSLPAAKLGLKKRGVLKEGYYADIVVFDYEEIEDFATYSDPQRFPGGIEGVIVNGQPVFDGNNLIDVNCGKILRS